jgi:hypothetical protein
MNNIDTIVTAVIDTATVTGFTVADKAPSVQNGLTAAIDYPLTRSKALFATKIT